MHRLVNRKNQKQGFTLIEMLLVLVIISALIMAGFNYFQQKTLQNKIDKTALEMQQILTAAMTFYAAKGVWPNADSGASADIIACMTGNNVDFTNGATTIACDLNLLPTAPNAPWLQAAGGLTPYEVVAPDTMQNNPKFYVYIPLVPATNANRANIYAGMIANKMPLGYTSADTATIPPATDQPCTAMAACVAVAAVMPPGQSLMNAGNVNFAGVYNYGGCIPVPSCPSDPANPGTTLEPKVFVVPVSITGFYAPPVAGVTNAYPITSFTAYAKGSATLDATPPLCNATSTGPSTCPVVGNTRYWRACVDIQTQQGSPQFTTGYNWTQNVKVAAFTRCEPTGESNRNGGGISVFE